MKTEGRFNPPLTMETPENAGGGIAIVLLPGYGPHSPDPESGRPRGLVTSSQVDRGPVVREVLKWLSDGGLDLRRHALSFRLVIWPASWEKSLHGPQMVPELVRCSDAFVQEMTTVRPSKVVLVSCYLHDALDSPEMHARLFPAFGKPLTPPARLCRTRLRAQVQRWERTLVVSVPIPGTSTTHAFKQVLTASLTSWLHS